jgi:hypothetical protein
MPNNRLPEDDKTRLLVRLVPPLYLLVSPNRLWLSQTLHRIPHMLVFTTNDRASQYLAQLHRLAQEANLDPPDAASSPRSRMELIASTLAAQDEGCAWGAIDHGFWDGGRVPLEDLRDYLYSLPVSGESN